MNKNQNPGIHTGGGAYFGTTHFTGGGHAFGNNSTVNNIREYVLRYEYHGKVEINQLTDANELKKIQSIINLPRAQAGRKDYQTKKKSGPCFPGTREALLREMMDWVTGPGESKMYALSGLAGIGKSTVVYTVAMQADELGLLGASFFFSRDEADRRSARKFFTTIAYQLCLFNEAFARAIAGALVTERGSIAITGSPEEQLHALILDPLQAVVTPNTPQTLIVVDALDECDDEDAPSILTGLRQLVQALPSFKVILTTRPQPLFNDFTTLGGNKIFHLQNIEDKVVNEDIRLYLSHSLSQPQVRAQLRNPTMQWCASTAHLERLVHAAGKLFIMASTAVRYILDKYWSDPAGRIKTLLGAFDQGRTPFNNLSNFYTIILRSAVPADCSDRDLVKRYQAIIGTIVLSQVPLSIHTLASLIDIEAEQISVVLHQLQSVILVGTDNIPLIYHTSFSDYITDSARCHDVNLHIDPKIRHTWIATRCFWIMERHLKYNILGLGNPARFMSNEDGLAKDRITEKQLQEKIPQLMRYACVYWANHLEVANIEDADLAKWLEKFADQCLLPWLEALSFIKKLDSAHYAMHVALKRLKPTSSDLRRLLSDGLRFLSKFYEIIERSALHTYYSALAFTPTDSLLYRRYITGVKHDICRVIGGLDGWNALVAHSNHGEEVDSFLFSLDDTMFASQSRKKAKSKGVLKVWDATTGAPISTTRGSNLAIANDFSTVASFKDNTIRLYHVNGSEQGSTLKTQAEISQLAISSERIAATFPDGTVCLWDSRNGELVWSFSDYENGSCDQNHLQFSATGARLAYSSAFGVVKLRNGTNGRLIGKLGCGSTAVAFSRDGSRIATLSQADLGLWRCEDGGLVGTAKNAGQYMLAISANGFLLATGDIKVKLWSGNVGNSGDPLPLVEVLDIHIDLDPSSMAFSQDDTLAIATRSNIVLYNIKSQTFISTIPFSSSAALALSLDCARLAARSTGSTVYLWDTLDVQVSNPSNHPARSRIIALTLSRDCSRVACGFENGVIELWETVGLTRQQCIDAYARVLMFSPDGRRLVSGSPYGSIKLWDSEDRMLHGVIGYSERIEARLFILDVSDTMLAAGGDKGVVLWDLQTLDHIHTFEGFFTAPLSFSADGTLLAVVGYTISCEIVVFDVARHTVIACLDAPDTRIRGMAFSPNNSQLVLQLFNDDLLTFNNSLLTLNDDPVASNDDVLTSDAFLALNLVNKKLVQGPTTEDLIQLPSFPLWQGVPAWLAREGEQYYLWALFPQHDDPVPVLWIPQELHVREWAQGRSTIALGCEDGRIVLLRLPGH